MSKHSHDHHDHKHDHDHDHSHHHHGPKNYNKAFAIGVALNITFVVVEAVYGFFSHSLALMADAGHNLSDVAGLLLAWAAVWMTAKQSTTTYTFGFRKSTILSALLNAIILLVAVGIIIWESIQRLMNPNPIDSKTVIIVAGIGILINGFTALLFFKDKEHDINMKGAYLHMAADALISLGVVVTGVIYSFTMWTWIDPVVSIIISIVIIVGTWDLFKNSLHMSLDAVPYGINPDEVKKYLEAAPGVQDVHDLHIWPLSTTENALSVHLTLKNNLLENQLLIVLNKELKERFKIDHPTIQFESMDGEFHCPFKQSAY